MVPMSTYHGKSDLQQESMAAAKVRRRRVQLLPRYFFFLITLFLQVEGIRGQPPYAFSQSNTTTTITYASADALKGSLQLAPSRVRASAAMYAVINASSGSPTPTYTKKFDTPRGKPFQHPQRCPKNFCQPQKESG